MYELYELYELYVHSWSDGAMLKSMAIRSWRSQPCKKSWRSRKFPRFASTLTHIDSHWLWFCLIWLNKVQLWLRHKCIIWQKLTYNPYNLLVAISRCVKDINVTITVAVSEFFFSDNNMFWNACWEQVQVVNKVVEVWEFQWQLQIAEPDTWRSTVWEVANSDMKPQFELDYSIPSQQGTLARKGQTTATACVFADRKL